MKTPLITREGYEKLKQEMDYLWRQERPEVTKKVTWAASLGDRSENADYQYIVNTPAGEASWYVNEIEYVK
ncbi:hypothetical protein BXT92_04875 [Klebsiella pneumoniae]|nr:hypothetical protein BXT92_04875 [Klebsiella pneumoniae]